jgi:hypothetical protein
VHANSGNRRYSWRLLSIVVTAHDEGSLALLHLLSDLAVPPGEGINSGWSRADGYHWFKETLRRTIEIEIPAIAVCEIDCVGDQRPKHGIQAQLCRKFETGCSQALQAILFLLKRSQCSLNFLALSYQMDARHDQLQGQGDFEE